jgi:FADH2 O2-dependent halogenase
LDVIKLLQGDVYDVDHPPVLERMKQVIRSVESQPDHIWHGFLGSLTADTLRSAFSDHPDEAGTLDEGASAGAVSA